MPSFGHVAVGLAAGRLQAKERLAPGPTLVLAALAVFPDLDVWAWRLGAGRHSVWLHRGALHSLLVAALVAVVGALLLDRGRRSPATLAIAFATAASHGLLDCITHGGAGVMLLWPFSQERFLAPWQLLPASPIGPGLFSPRGLWLMLGEALLFAPFLVYALRPGKPRTARRGGMALPADGAVERSS